MHTYIYLPGLFILFIPWKKKANKQIDNKQRNVRVRYFWTFEESKLVEISTNRISLERGLVFTNEIILLSQAHSNDN